MPCTAALAEHTPAPPPFCSEPEPSPGLIPTHLWEPLKRSFGRDHYVDDTGDIVFYKQDPDLPKIFN